MTNIESLINEIENNLTLKSDYKEELQKLDNINSTLSVMFTMNEDRLKISQLKKRIKHIESWIKEEITYQNKL